MLRGQEDVVGKQPLGGEVDPTVLEVRIEFLLALPIAQVKALPFVIVGIEGLVLLLRIQDTGIPFRYGLVQQAVTHKVHQPVLRHPRRVFREEMRMLLDKGDDVVVPLFGRLEAAHAVPGDNELVTTNTAAVAVQTNVRGVADTVLPVQMIPGILQHLLDVDALFEIFIGQFRHIYRCVCVVFSLWVYIPWRISWRICSFAAASKFRAATSIGVSTPGLK